MHCNEIFGLEIHTSTEMHVMQFQVASRLGVSRTCLPWPIQKAIFIYYLSTRPKFNPSLIIPISFSVKIFEIFCKWCPRNRINEVKTMQRTLFLSNFKRIISRDISPQCLWAYNKRNLIYILNAYLTPNQNSNKTNSDKKKTFSAFRGYTATVKEHNEHGAMQMIYILYAVALFKHLKLQFTHI